MKYTQKIPYGFTRTQFEFTETHLDYLVKGEKFDFGFVLPYENIYPEQTLRTVIERWPLLVGCTFWVACVLDRLMGLGSKHYDSSNLLLLTFLVLSIIFMAAGKSMRNDALSVKTTLGNIIILKDENQKAIRDEIEARRVGAIKKKYTGINPFNNPAEELARLRNFKDDGILSEAEFNGLASQISIIKQ